MSQTVMMPSSFDQAVKEMCASAVAQAVGVLAEKYGFDPEDAARELNMDELKLVRKRGPSPKKATGDKKPKATKAAGDKPKTKRPKTGYLLFADSARTEVREEMLLELAEGTKLQPQAVVAEIAKRWKALDDDERQEWNAEAKAAASQSDEDVSE